MARSGKLWALLLGVGALGYYLYKNSASAMAAGAAASLAPTGSSPAPAVPAGAVGLPVPLLPGSSAPSMSQLYAASSFWSALTPTSPPSAGYINLPSGTQVPAANLGAGNTAMDDQGNVYISWGGQVYALSFPDSNGNWPATLVQGANS